MTNEPEPNTRAGEAQAHQLATALMGVERFTADGNFHPDYLAMLTRPLPQPSELVERAKQQIQLGKMTGSHTGSRLNIYQIAEELLTQIAKLQARLEVVPGWSEDADGIACRNDTIKLQDECIAKLQADGDKLAGALEQLIKHTTWLESVAPPMCIDGKYMGESLSLADACQALTEWKDRA